MCIFHLKSRCERWYGNIIVWLWRTNSRRWRPQWQARSRLYALYVLLFFFFYNSGAWNNSNTIRPFSVIWIIGKEIYVNLRIQILCFQVTHTHSVVYLCGEARSSVQMIWSQCVLHWSETCIKKTNKQKKNLELCSSCSRIKMLLYELPQRQLVVTKHGGQTSPCESVWGQDGARWGFGGILWDLPGASWEVVGGFVISDQ